MIFASPNVPYFENWGRPPGSILQSSAPGDLNKYLHDTFAITSPDPILFGSQVLNSEFYLYPLSKPHLQNRLIDYQEVFTHTGQRSRHITSKINLKYGGHIFRYGSWDIQYYCDYLPHTRFRFYLIKYQLDTDFPSRFCVFTVKSPSVTQRSVFKKMLLKRAKTRRLFFSKTIGSYNSFTLISGL